MFLLNDTEYIFRIQIKDYIIQITEYTIRNTQYRVQNFYITDMGNIGIKEKKETNKQTAKT